MSERACACASAYRAQWLEYYRDHRQALWALLGVFQLDWDKDDFDEWLFTNSSHVDWHGTATCEAFERLDFFYPEEEDDPWLETRCLCCLRLRRYCREAYLPLLDAN